MARSVVEMGMELLRQQNGGTNEAGSVSDEQMSEQNSEPAGEDEPVSQEESDSKQEDGQVNTVLAGLVDRLDQLAVVLDRIVGRLGGGQGIAAPSSDAQYAAGDMKEG